MARFIRSIDETYDFVFATGDLLGGPESVDLCAVLLNSLKAEVGRYFVLGSSDYYAPRIKNYIDYFLKRRKHGTRRNPTGEFRERLARQGWIELTNAQILGNFDGLAFQITGLDDPYLHRDDRTILLRDPEVDLAMCLAHAPDPYLDASAAGYDLMICGHTHGGQVRLPFIGAVVTNSTIPRAFARGASKIGQMWLFITPGLGTGKYAPFRFMCRPEVSILEIVPRAGQAPHLP